MGGLLSTKKLRPKKRILCKPTTEAQFSIIQGLGPILEPMDFSLGPEVPSLKQDEDGSFFAGMVMCSDPISNSDMIQCNSRLWDNVESNVGGKIWKVISKLGV